MADSLNNRVRITDATGVYLKTLAGNMIAGFSGDGGPATNAQLLDPNDVAVQSFENFYIADSANNRIRQVTSNGVISTVAGNGIRGFSGDGSIACNASLYKPLSLCLDTGGNLYIADTFNNRVREVSPFATGPILTLNAVPMSEAGSYTVIVSDSSGSTNSSVAVLTVFTLPAITVQPANQSLVSGSNATLSVTATGTPPLSYEWLFDGANVMQTGPSNILALTDVSTNDAGSYSVVVTRAF